MKRSHFTEKIEEITVIGLMLT